MPYGRGGAGNILQAKEDSKKVTPDIEANRASAPDRASSSASTTQQPSEYAHMGRGGAGNWFQPTELQKEGTFTQPTDATAIPTTSKPQISTPWHPEGQEMPVARSGRGGAGNFVWKSEEQARKEREDDARRKESVREGVERDVEAALPKPPGALLGMDKAGRGW